MAYMAGLFDGDGSFTLTRATPRKETHSSLYTPLVQFCNRNKKPLEMIQELFGGYINERKPYIAKDGGQRQASFTLKIKGTPNCKPFLESIKPFLIIKRDRAIFLLSFMEKNPFNRSSIKLSQEIIDSRDLDYAHMKSLNDKRDSNYKISIKHSRKNSFDECFWAYLAGIFDTDGSFSIRRNIGRKDCKNTVYGISISLSMVDSRAVQYIRDNCNFGSIFMVTSKTATQRFCYRFFIGDREQSILFIKRILPYLNIKKESALILLEFCEKINLTRGKEVSQEELIFREDCYQRLIKTNANKDGVYKSSLIVLKTLPGDAGGNKEQAGGSTVQLERSKREDADNKGDAVL